jgi:hypothetical protein
MHAIGRLVDSSPASAIEGHGVHVHYSYEAGANETHFREKATNLSDTGDRFQLPIVHMEQPIFLGPESVVIGGGGDFGHRRQRTISSLVIGLEPHSP